MRYRLGIAMTRTAAREDFKARGALFRAYFAALDGHASDLEAMVTGVAPPSVAQRVPVA